MFWKLLFGSLHFLFDCYNINGRVSFGLKSAEKKKKIDFPLTKHKKKKGTTYQGRSYFTILTVETNKSIALLLLLSFFLFILIIITFSIYRSTTKL